MSAAIRFRSASIRGVIACLLVALAGAQLRPAPAVAAGLPADSSRYQYVVHWSTLPDKDLLQGSAYTAWSRRAIPRAIMVAGVTGLATYRAAAGGPHIINVFSFPSFAALAAWRNAPDIEALHEQSREFTYELASEIWGPSPTLPDPIVAEGRAVTDSSHVFYVVAWNEYPRKIDAYRRWIVEASKRWARGPEILAVRGYRELAGAHADVFTFEFPSLEAWARWYGDAGMQKTRAESRELVIDTRTELWGPNPMLPVPMSAQAMRERLRH